MVIEDQQDNQMVRIELETNLQIIQMISLMIELEKLRMILDINPKNIMNSCKQDVYTWKHSWEMKANVKNAKVHGDKR